MRKVRDVTPDEQQDEQFYRDTESIAFPKLDDHQLSLLEPLGERRVLKRGELVRTVSLLQAIEADAVHAGR